MSTKVKWLIQRGYSIESQLAADGLSFEAFDLIEKSTDSKTIDKVKGKIVSRLAKELRSDCLEQGLDISKVTHGCYCIALGTGFEVDYTMQSSRVVYVGSGSVYGRIKSHLKGKLFDFASALRSVPLRFYVCDLSDAPNSKTLQRALEQALLNKFSQEIDTAFPLLNARNASAKPTAVRWESGWDKPLHKDRGRQTTNWLIKPADAEDWKGAL